MGLKGKFEPLPGCTTFYFRVRTPRGYTFDVASFQHKTLGDAHAALTKTYPGAKIFALEETEFAADGLPAFKTTVRLEGWIYRKSLDTAL